VTFAAGAPFKEGYRRFRIRTVPGADDYAMLYEVLKRRYEKRENLPDLLMVDGGKGQLGVALAVLKDLRIEGVDVIGMAKERDDLPPYTPAPPPDHLPSQGELHGGLEGTATVYKLSPPTDEKGNLLPPVDRHRRTDTPGKKEDRVYLPGRKDPVYLSRWPMALFLLQRIRDEAHRFAVSYHRKVKEKEDLQSLLDRIPGIGAARKKALLTFFGDVKRIRSASIDDLQQVEGIGGELADRIHKFLRAEQ
jgi:excinuclease ABC subunit C